MMASCGVTISIVCCGWGALSVEEGILDDCRSIAVGQKTVVDLNWRLISLDSVINGRRCF